MAASTQPCETSPGWSTSRSRHAIRLGLHHVAGISDAEIAAIESARAEGGPFRSLEDFVRRTGVSRPVVENLVHVGAFDSLAPKGRRALLWRVQELWAATGNGGRARNRQPELPLAAPTESVPLPGLRDYSEQEKVRAELEVLGMDVTRHLLTFYEPECRRLGTIPSAEARTRHNGEMVTVAGVKVATQTPAVRSGRRIIFLTLDDPTGPSDVTVFPDVQDRCARPAFDGFVLAVRGKLRRTGPTGRGVSVTAADVWDLQRLAADRGPDAADPPTVPPRHLWHQSPGSSGGPLRKGSPS